MAASASGGGGAGAPHIRGAGVIFLYKEGDCQYILVGKESNYLTDLFKDGIRLGFDTSGSMKRRLDEIENAQMIQNKAPMDIQKAHNYFSSNAIRLTRFYLDYNLNVFTDHEGKGHFIPQKKIPGTVGYEIGRIQYTQIEEFSREGKNYFKTTYRYVRPTPYFKFGLPKGRREGLESPSENIIREVKEEIGLHLSTIVDTSILDSKYTLYDSEDGYRFYLINLTRDNVNRIHEGISTIYHKNYSELFDIRFMPTSEIETNFRNFNKLSSNAIHHGFTRGIIKNARQGVECRLLADALGGNAVRANAIHAASVGGGGSVGGSGVDRSRATTGGGVGVVPATGGGGAAAPRPITYKRSKRAANNKWIYTAENGSGNVKEEAQTSNTPVSNNESGGWLLKQSSSTKRYYFQKGSQSRWINNSRTRRTRRRRA